MDASSSDAAYSRLCCQCHQSHQAETAGGEPVDIRLVEKGPDRTELRIRIGVFGNEARSRLVLEQIHQSL